MKLMSNLHAALRTHFHFDHFRPGQQDIVQSILDGHDTLALLPTGGGKSLCYQLPATQLPGITLVISPLIALMKDQVDALTARGIPATYLNSTVSSSSAQTRMAELQSGKIKLLYAAPERLSQTNFQHWLHQLNLSLIAIDEAHCVSQWGHDFRPDYLKIKHYLQKLPHRPIVAAFTATATPEVKQDIIARLSLQSPQIFVRGFDRPNLRFFARPNLKVKQRQQETARIIKSLTGSGIVYVITRKGTQDLADFLNSQGITAVAYHAGLSADQRTKIQDQFMDNQYQVIVATIAFGMGVDKADIRWVIHMGMPATLENYYQEAGRAGRDGEVAYCILLHSGRDTSLHHFFLTQSKQEMKQQGKPWDEISQLTNLKYRKLEKILAYANSTTCRRQQILEYFADPDATQLQSGCKACDICLNYQWKTVLDTRKSQSRLTSDQPSGTILETAKLYQSGHTPEQIAKIRSLSPSTVFNHLIDWYLGGGDFNPDDYLTPDIQSQIFQALSQTPDLTKLKPIKDLLPESITYDQIRLVLAKLQRIKLT